MDKDLRAYLVELVGTFTLVLLSASLVCAVKIRVAEGEPSIGLVSVAVGLGCLMAVLLTVTTRVSDGCLSPAVSIMLWVTGRFTGKRAIMMSIVQVVGGVLAGWFIALIFSDQVLRDSYAGTPHLQESLRVDGKVTFGSLLAGVAIETGLAFLFTLSLFVTVFDPKRLKMGGLLAGVSYTACVLIGYHLTGASVNPARWAGTAIWQPTVAGLETKPVFDDHLIYWMGPIVGGLLAGIVYTSLIRPPEKPSVAK